MEEYTSKELELRPGEIELARAVIEQWKLDGKPKCDEPAIRYWAGIIDYYGALGKNDVMPLSYRIGNDFNRLEEL